MSRELDVRVARALGLDVCQCKVGSAVSQGNRLVCANWSCGKPISRAYSSFIAAAIPLFDWLAERGLVRLSNGDGDSKDCDFSPDGFLYPDLRCARVSVDTWARAICLAFLVANGID